MRNVRILTASRIGASLLAFAVSACTVIPGSNLNRPLSMIGGQFSDDGSQVVQADIDFVRITPSTIRQLSDRKAMSASNQVQQQSSLEPYVYRIGIGDVLDITVWEDPGSFRTSNESIREKSGTLVHGDGTIYFPFVGVLPVVGKTTFEVRDEIRKSLSRVVTEPRVDVNIMQFKSQKVYVSGAVNRAGVLPIEDVPLTLVRAVQQAGGLGENANWRDVRLTRGGITQSIDLYSVLKDGRWEANMRLQNGDIVHILRNDDQKVFVMGEVFRSRSLPIGQTPLSLAEALADVGGIREGGADARGIFVLRNVEKRVANGTVTYASTVYNLNAASADAFLLAEHFKLEPRDVVYVSPAPVQRWNRLISALLPSLLVTENVQDIENN